MKYRILSLHAHPDDAEILAGGTLALLAERGQHVIIATMTSGDCGTAEHSPEAISDIRRSEAARAAALIGAEYHCLGFGDMCIFQDDAARRRVTAAIRRHRPDIILTSAPSDYHCDHESTSALVRDACFAAPAPNYHTLAYDNAAPIPAIPHLYFMDPVEGRDRQGRPVPPDFIVDISAVFEIKRRMLLLHDSQRSWLLRQHGMDDYILTMQRWSAQRGAAIGKAYGEGFRHYKGHPYPASPLLEELLAPAVHVPA